MARYKSWEQIRREIDVNEDHVAAYGLLDEAERSFYAARQRRGFTDAMMAEALGVEEEDAWSVEAEDATSSWRPSPATSPRPGDGSSCVRCSRTRRSCCCASRVDGPARPAQPSARS